MTPTPTTPAPPSTRGTASAATATAPGQTPAVSVLMAVHDSARYLRQAVASVLEQTFGDFELVIVDDASADDSPRIIDHFTDPRIVRLRNEENLGLAASLNRGLERCRADLIARMDGDDVCEPTRLAEQVEHLSANPRLGVVGTWTTEIDEAGRETRPFEPCGEPAYVRWCTFHRNIVYHPTAMMRRSALAIVGGYDERFRFAQDYDLFARMILAGVEIGILERRLLRYRRSPGAITSMRQEEQLRLASRVREHYNAGMLGRDVPSTDADSAARLLSWQQAEPNDARQAVVRLLLEQRRMIRRTASGRVRAQIDADIHAHLSRQGRRLLGADARGARRLAWATMRLGGGWRRSEAWGLWTKSWRVQAGLLRRRAGLAAGGDSHASQR